MKRAMLSCLAGLSAVVLFTPATPARAMVIAPTPVPMRVATADLVIVGKVTGFTDKLESVRQGPPDSPAIEYQVAIVKVKQALLGGKALKEVRVGFLPAPPAEPGAPPGGVRPHIRIRRMPRFELTLNQEACLFLTRHPTANFYVGQTFYNVISKTDNPNFEKELKEVKHSAKLLADPRAGLKSDNADDRLLTAGLLIARYRTPRPGVTKTEPIDAQESKLILQALAKADWPQTPARPFQMTPQNLFVRLNLSPQDGWNPPQNFQEYPQAAKKWLKENADTYRIQRFVEDRPARDRKKD